MASRTFFGRVCYGFNKRLPSRSITIQFNKSIHHHQYRRYWPQNDLILKVILKRLSICDASQRIEFHGNFCADFGLVISVQIYPDLSNFGDRNICQECKNDLLLESFLIAIHGVENLVL